MPGKTTESAKTASQSGRNGASLISDDKLRHLYATMVKCRLLEERARFLPGQRNFGAQEYTGNGREAAIVGCAIDLRPEDTIVPFPADHSAGFVKGFPLSVLLSGSYLETTGTRDEEATSPRPNGTSWHVVSAFSPGGAHVSVGAGIALANKMDKNGRVVVVFQPEQSAALVLWRETLAFCGIHNLPIVFVSLGAFLAEPLRQLEQSKEEHLNTNALQYGFPRITVDGCDVIAVYRVAHEAIAKARLDAGPTLIECAYKSPRAKEEDPIRLMASHLRNKGLWSDQFHKDLRTEFSRQLESAVSLLEKTTRQRGNGAHRTRN